MYEKIELISLMPFENQHNFKLSFFKDFLPLIKLVTQIPIFLKWEEMFRIISKNLFPIKVIIQFSYLPSCNNLALIAIPWPMASGLQTGGHISARQEIRKLKKNHKGK